RPVTRESKSARYWRMRRPRPTGMERYGIQSRARHTVLESQRSEKASYQYAVQRMKMTMQNASASRLVTNASQYLNRGPKCRGRMSTLTCPRVISTYALPTKVAPTMQYVTTSICQIVVKFKT